MHLSALLAICLTLVSTVLSAVAFPRPYRLLQRDGLCSVDPVLQALYDNSADASAFCSCYVGGSTLYTFVAASTVTNVIVVSTETPLVTVFSSHVTSQASPTAIQRRQLYDRYCCETIPAYLESCSVSTQQISSACSCLITVSAIDTQTVTTGDVKTVEISSTLTLPTVTVYNDAVPSTSIPSPSVSTPTASASAIPPSSTNSVTSLSIIPTESGSASSAYTSPISSSKEITSSVGPLASETSSTILASTTSTSASPTESTLTSAPPASSTEPIAISSSTTGPSIGTPTTIGTDVATTLPSSSFSATTSLGSRTRTADTTATSIPQGCSAPIVGCVFGMAVFATFSITDPNECQPLCTANSNCQAYQIGTDQSTFLTTFCELLNVPALSAWDVTGSGINNAYCSHFFCYDAKCPWVSGFPFYFLQ